MKTILFHQSLTQKGKDILVINGDKQELNGSNKETLSFFRTDDMQDFSRFCTLFSDNPNVGLYIGKKGEVLLTSNFLTKDERGRYVTFSYYCDKINDQTLVIDRFCEYCKIAEMQFKKQDVEILKKMLFVYNNKCKLLVAAGFAIAIIIFGLCNINN